jgi:catechol 2,3-dioxygenase-like lactoylglutathione lyase family enzyme
MTGNSSVENSEPSETSTSEWPAVSELSRFTPPHGATLGRVSLIGMRPQPLIAVTDVETSSRWYQRLLGCRSNHGGSEYEQLVSNDQLVLQLHRFEVEHHHGPIGDRNDKPYGNGVVLWFEVDDFDSVIQRASEMGVEIVMPKHRNPPDGEGGPNHWECWMRDSDGYVVVVASPYGTASGTWRPRAVELRSREMDRAS